MKKLIAVALLLLILAIAGVYAFIPSNLTVSNVAVFRGSTTGTNRVLTEKKYWKKFWQGKTVLTPTPAFTNDDLFLHDNDTFRVAKLLQNSLLISISERENQINSRLLILSLRQDSIALQWSYDIKTSYNPFIRFQQYRNAVHLKENMTSVLKGIKIFLAKDENVYGLTITQTSTNDTLLVSTKKITTNYPSTNDIYSSLTKLEEYARQNDASQTGFPMFNVTELGKNEYALMTALPINKLLKESGDITYKRMIPGRFLTTTVTGGNATVSHAYGEMQQYFQDYRRTSMAIPFMYLITDRSKESDTSKWVTKLYFPVM